MSLRLLVDTNRYAAPVANDPAAVARISQADEIWLPLITVAELLAGFQLGTRRQENEQRLSQLLDQQGVGVLSPDLETTGWYADIFYELRRAGRKIPTNDIWIAALARQHDLVLDTDDEHFRQISGLQIADDA